MIARYQDPFLHSIWSREAKLNLWVRIELLTLSGWHEEGTVPTTDWELLKDLKTSLKELDAREEKTDHELAALVDCLAEKAGVAGRWIHFGLTSNDVLDTADHFLTKQSIEYVMKILHDLFSLLGKNAKKSKRELMIGRTHGVFAEPITLGLKLALWAAELKRHFQSLNQAKEAVSVCKIAGPTGLRPDIPLSVNKHVAAALGMKVSFENTQIIPRDRMLKVVFAIQNLSLTIEKIAIELRNLQRSEIGEFCEPFSQKQKGSSAMPHKKNPKTLENICGLARLLRGLALSLNSINLLWHERDLTNSSIERVALPDIFHLIATMMKRLHFVLENGSFQKQAIKKNLQKSLGSVISHRLILFLIKEKKIVRDRAYRTIQSLNLTFGEDKEEILYKIKKNSLFSDFSEKKWNQIASEESFFKNIDDIFESLNL